MSANRVSFEITATQKNDINKAKTDLATAT